MIGEHEFEQHSMITYLGELDSQSRTGDSFQWCEDKFVSSSESVNRIILSRFVMADLDHVQDT